MKNIHLKGVQRELLDLAKELLSILDKNKLGYAVDSGTMLGTVRHQGFIPGDDDFDIQITKETYDKLKELYPNRIINSKDQKGKYPLMMPKGVPNNQNFLRSPLAVDLFIIVPSTKKRVKKYRHGFNAGNHGFMALQTTGKPFNIATKLLKIITGPGKLFINFFGRDFEYQLNILTENEKPEGFFVLDNPTIKLKDLGYDEFDFKCRKMKFEDIQVKVPINYDELLKRKYSSNYMTPIITKKAFYHVDAVSVQKVNNKVIKVKNA